MNIYDFISESNLSQIEKKIKSKQPFAYKKTVKGVKDKITISFYSANVSKELADDIWNGEQYLVHIQIDHNGKTNGIGGYGYATNKYKEFINGWAHFKQWFDGLLICYSDYKTKRESNQMSLFDW